jgi:opacity protein-like surface antigen
MRLIFVVAASLAIASASSAQLFQSYGIKAGPVLAGQHWDYAPSSPLAGLDIADQMRWGIDVGCFVEWFDHPTLSLLTEVHYVQRGFRDEYAVTSPTSPEIIGTEVLTPRLDYLSMPLLLKARLDYASVSPYVLAGPRFDILLNKNPDNFDLIVDKFKKYDWGLTLGGGIAFEAFPGYDIGAEFRYELSLQDIYRTDMLTVRNHSMQFLAYVAF